MQASNNKAILEILSCYFVDIFYNHLYISAKEFANSGGNNRGATVTDAYKTNIINYVKGLTNRHENYTRTIKDLHKRFQIHMKLLSLTEMETKILLCFIPQEYLKVMKSADKDKALAKIIMEIIESMAKLVFKKHLSNVVDYRNSSNPPLLQDDIILVMNEMRESYFAMFAKEAIGRGAGNEITDKYRDAIAAEVQKRCKAEQERDKLISIVNQMRGRIAELETQLRAPAVATTATPVAPAVQPKQLIKPSDFKTPAPVVFEEVQEEADFDLKLGEPQDTDGGIEDDFDILAKQREMIKQRGQQQEKSTAEEIVFDDVDFA